MGTPFDDRLRGTRGDPVGEAVVGGGDVIVSLGGDDVITGLNMFDVVCTGTGNDRVVNEQGGLVDVIHVRLGQGDDLITFVNRVDGRYDDAEGTIRAGAGDDTVLIAEGGAPFVVPGPGDDVVRAVPVRDYRKSGQTCVRFGSATGPVRVNLALGRASGQGRDRLIGIQCVVGGAFNDVLIGTSGMDEIKTGGGLNLVRTRSGIDFVVGGDRADEVHLGRGADTVLASSGWDRLYGGPGGDVLEGYGDGDYLDGGPGDDYLFSGPACERSGPPQGSGDDTDPNELFGRDGSDFLAGEQGNDRLDGGPGVDSGQGGYLDGRIDWITSVEIHDECRSPYQ